MKKYILILTMFLCSFSAIAQNYKTHKVKQGETIEQIAKSYLVTPFDIYALNPDAKNGLSTNTVLIIPVSKVKNPTENLSKKEVVSFKKHKVRRKETLYSISQKYNIEIEDIKKHNKRLYSENLRKGDRIQIPRFKTGTKAVTLNNTLKKYTILPKEGKWRVAYKFGITVEELEALNPNMNDILQPGEEVNVPNIANNEERPVEENYNYYKVLPKEGFYRLKVKLGIEQDELETLNPDLKTTGLKEGMVLRVPLNISTNNEGIVGENTTSTSNVNNLISRMNDYSQKRIAIMLPFKLNSATTDSIDDARQSIEKNPYLNTSLDFYSGSLMALDSLKRLGLNLKVDVYDTKNLASEVQSIISNNNFKDTDLVIGPLIAKNVEQAASLLQRYDVPVISPITKTVKLLDNVFQSIPSDKLLQSRIIDFVKKDSLIGNIIIVADSKNKVVSNMLKTKFVNATQVFSRKDKKGKDDYYVRIDDIKLKLKSGKNIVFLETKSPIFVSNVTSVLNSLNDEKQPIILVTTNRNKAFEDDEVSNQHLSNLHFHFPSISKAYNEDDNNSFVKNYVKTYNETPSKYAVRGFDITMDAILRLAAYEDLYKSADESETTEYVENKFAYEKKLFGGYYNNAVYLVKYDDLNIVEVN